MKISVTNFGFLPQGQKVDLITLDNGSMSVSLCPYGACITSILTPDKNGVRGENVLGFDSLEDYLNDHPYYGVVVGPVANRISNSRFTIDNKEYQLDQNEGNNHLHGGKNAFDKQIWDYRYEQDDDCLRLIMFHKAADGAGGYPGNRECSISFSLYTSNILDIKYNVRTDCASPVNLTHHEYFNLADGDASPIFDHDLQVMASNYTPVKNDGCVTGEISEVSGTRFDLRQRTKLSDVIRTTDEDDPDIAYDHNFVLDSDDEPALFKAAVLSHQGTGRQLEVWTTQPCLQLYTSQYMDGTFRRKDRPFHAYHGICLETQSFPDSVNQDAFPDIILREGELYEHICRYVFKILDDE